MKKLIEYGLVIICLIPLFSINIQNTHDWGDDFAQYVHQAKNISEGISQNETGYIFNENCFTGPQAYPTGFPLLLSPIIKMFGVNYYYLNLLQTLFLALTCFIGFVIIRQYASFFSSFFAVCIIAYNPVLLHFKAEILSDLPFTFFSLLCLFLISKKHNYVLSIILGVLIGFTIHIRSVGVILIFAFIFNRLFLENKISQFSIKTNLNTLVTIITCTLVYFTINLAWPCDTNYPGIFETQNFWQTINDHLSYNIYHLSMLFRGYAHANYWYIGVIASCSLIVFAILGFIYFFKENKKSIYGYYVLCYLFLIISYKHSHAGIRFLYPIMIFIFLFTIVGLQKTLDPFMREKKWLALIFGLLIIYSYQEEIVRIEDNKNKADGPTTLESKELFHYINNFLPQQSVIAFDKPRALTLYCKVQSFAFYPENNDEAIEKDIQKFHAKYYLTHITESTANILNHPLKDSTHFSLIFQNKNFNLFQIK